MDRQSLRLRVQATSCGHVTAERGDCATIKTELQVAAVRLELIFEVPDAPLRLDDLVPAARVICSKLVELTRAQAEANGLVVPCGKKCTACCKYLVPLSVPEAFRLYRELQTFSPQRRRRLMKSFAKASRRILESSRPLLPNRLGSTRQDLANLTAGSISSWYAQLDIACPLLDGGLCVVYQTRPLACREHLVVSRTASRCDEAATDAQKLSPPISVLQALGRFAARLEGTPTQAVMLPLAVAWSCDQADRMARTWPAGEAINVFIDTLHGLAESPAHLTGQILAQTS